MKAISKRYKNKTVFAVLIQPNLVSVEAQITDELISRNIYVERIYKTNDLNGAIDYYIRKELEGL